MTAMSIIIYQYFSDGFWNCYDELTSLQIAEAKDGGLECIALDEGQYRPGTPLHNRYEILLHLNLQRNIHTGGCKQIRKLLARTAGFDPLPDFEAAKDPSADLLIEVSIEDLPEPDTDCLICLGPFGDAQPLLSSDPLSEASSDTLTSFHNFPSEDYDTSGPVKLPQCTGHYFHADCILEWLREKHQCPYCKQFYGRVTGDCPEGIMTISHTKRKLPGWTATSMLHTAEKSDGTWIMQWTLFSGRQGPQHPNPGKLYHGTSRVGFLPDTPDYRKVLKMLMIAWQRRLMFTIGFSLTRGVHDVITWSGIHIRTEWEDHYGFGWPCPGYYDNITLELSSKGITPEQELE